MPSPTDIRLNRIEDLADMQAMIPTSFLEAEDELMVIKWPAYRFLSPKHATALFIAEYAKAYKTNWSENQDRDEAARMTPTAKLDTTCNNAKFTQMWHARQAADLRGVPYDFYLKFCFDFASKRSGRRYPPQPNQLGPNSKTEIAWHAEFAKAWKGHETVAFQRLDPMVQYK